MSNITSHVLDTSIGKPAQGVAVVLQRVEGDGAIDVGHARTDNDGRIKHFTDAALRQGDYRLVFDTRAYFTAQGRQGFYPEVCITFTVRAPNEHHHVPLLLNPFGYSTYRGS